MYNSNTQMKSYNLQIPFVTTSSDKIKTLIQLSECKREGKVVDLGSGDGRVVIALARAGFDVVGFEIRKELVERSLQKIAALGLDQKITIYHQNFWDANLSEFDLIYIYGMQSMLAKLEEKLETEMKVGAKFISNIFPLPRWKPQKVKDNFYVYTKKNKI
ncbi:MAG: 50S ribosomal protein L11 methyltransferase [Patescibacteria group bacterium]|nr:MAG: 50S ribosomal protein L11 methyltransferase [Patescibacteria group bacterium]